MKLSQFLESYHDLLTNSSTVVFQGQKEYPILFFSLLLQRIKTTYPDALVTLDCAEHDAGAIIANLESSFLGSRVVYWLKNLSTIDEKKRTQLNTYLANYRGPNCVVSYALVGTRISPQAVVVELSDAVNQPEFIRIFTFLDGDAAVKRASRFISVVYTRCESVALDQACLLMRYATLMGAGHQDFVDHWLDTFVVPEKSLFTLSQHFFAKSPKKFFTQWSRMSNDYAEPFWITFWAEQVWRAYHFVHLMQNKKFAEAKAVAYRLPFSLIQNDWKKIKLAELKHAHDFLYSCDFALKNGGDGIMLDLFYSRFFQNQFGS